MLDASDDRRVTTVAHRGFAERYPENTLRAVRGAARDGADAVEIDAVPCGDGTLVTFHDDRLAGRPGGGLTDAEGVVWETPPETVTNARVLGTEETVPTLRAALAAIPPAVGANVELKLPARPTRGSQSGSRSAS